MEDFKYCIWLIPDKNQEWINYTNGFMPHISIHTKIEDITNANKIYEEINIKEPIYVKLVGNLKKTITNGFYAIQQDVIPLNYKPHWWPENAHVSFIYSYSDIDNEILNNLKLKIKQKTCVMSSTIITKCTGNYKNWN